MPMLQYPSPNKPYKLFTDASKYSYSGILHQEKEGNAETLIPTVYFQVVLEEHSSYGMQYRKNDMQFTNHKKFSFFSDRLNVHSIVITNH